ncbi:MAG: AraC family transcriptional regulator [Candidatus Krumholzibacteriia bacterium]
MDVLSNVLRVLRLSGAVFLEAEFSAPWAVRSPPPGQLSALFATRAECIVLFHIVAGGGCWVACAGDAPRWLGPGAMVVLPRGDEHVMSSVGGSLTPTPITTLLPPVALDRPGRLVHGGGGPLTRMVCGYLQCEHRFEPLFGCLPRMTIVRGPGAGRDGEPDEPVFDDDGETVVIPGDDWLTSTARFVVAQTAEPQPGGAAARARTVELLFLEILRRQVHEGHADGHAESHADGHTNGHTGGRTGGRQGGHAGGPGWLAAVADDMVGPALRLIHDDPGRGWTVEMLARAVGASRSVFGERFAALVGEPPMHYCSHWRMHVARRLLQEEQLSLADIAARVGYESEAAFNRAFKRHTGAPPGRWRKEHVAAPLRT